MNVSLTGNDLCINLELKELNGSLTAENLRQFLVEKLAEFDISLGDIIGLTTDGASVMQKLQSSVDCFSQICLAHGIHLSVKDALISSSTHAQQALQDFSTEDEEEISEKDIYNPDYNMVITKMMKVDNKFHHSALLEDKLANYQVSAGKSPKKIVTHIKTRWNSLYHAIKRFLEVYPEIQKVFIDIVLIFTPYKLSIILCKTF